MMKITKKGLSHIEVILSFIVFVGFLIFLIGIFNPFKSQEKNRVYLDIAERGIKERSDVEVKFVTINLNENPRKCFSFNYSFFNVTAKDSNSNFLASLSQVYKGENTVFIDGADRGKFFYVYSSPEFIEKTFSTNGCDDLKTDEYQLGLYRTYTFSSNKSLVQLKDTYNDKPKYEDLKDELGVPSSLDFSFDVRDSLGNELVTTIKTIPKTVEIMSKDVPIQIAYSNGEIKTAVLNIKIW